MNKFKLILGPCGIEHRSNYFEIGKRLFNEYGTTESVDFYYKASFDKANRTSIQGERGVGLAEAIELFQEIKETYPSILLCTDIHECWQAERLSGIIDLCQIPAFLCKQTDLLIAATENFDKVSIKKGQWVAPKTMCLGLDKMNQDCDIWAIERGSQFGYEQLIVDFGAVDIMKESFDEVVFDCTHSTQRRKSNGFTGGDPELSQRYIKIAKTMGYTGIFAEVHPRPEESVSDKDSIMEIEEAIKCINSIL